MSDIYMSPTGSDAAAGTSQGSAWLTHNKLNASLATPGHGITRIFYDAVGQPFYADKPLILANQSGIEIRSIDADQYADIRFSKLVTGWTRPNAVTYPNVWANSDWTAYSQLWELTSLGEIPMAWVATTGTATDATAMAAVNSAAAYSYYSDDTTVIINIGKDPATTSIARSQNWLSSVTGWTTSAGGGITASGANGLELHHLRLSCTSLYNPSSTADPSGYTLRFSPAAGSSNHLHDLWVCHGGYHTIGLLYSGNNSSLLLERVVADQSNRGTAWVSYRSIDAADVTATHEFRRCGTAAPFELAGSAGGDVTSTNGAVYSHTNTTGQAGHTLLYSDCEFNSPLNVEANPATVTNCRMRGQSCLSGGANVTFSRCTFTKASTAAYTYTGSAACTAIVTDCEISGDWAPSSVSLAAVTFRGSLTMQRCLFDASAQTTMPAFQAFYTAGGASDSPLTFTDNVVAAPPDTNWYVHVFYSLRPSTNTYLFDRNTYVATSTASMCRMLEGSVDIQNFAQWQAAGRDPNSTMHVAAATSPARVGVDVMRRRRTFGSQLYGALNFSPLTDAMARSGGNLLPADVTNETATGLAAGGTLDPSALQAARDAANAATLEAVKASLKNRTTVTFGASSVTGTLPVNMRPHYRRKAKR
jgi:hypothetical protein